MKKLLITAVALCTAMAVAAHARSTSPGEIRGYNACRDAGDEQLDGLVLSRTYYLAQTNQGAAYFLNGTAWISGDRVDVRITCDTSANGRELRSIATNQGHFALEGQRGDLQIAGQ